MIRGQIASNEMLGTVYAEEINTLWPLRKRLCSLALPEGSKEIRADMCRICRMCAYGERLLQLIDEGKIKL